MRHLFLLCQPTLRLSLLPLALCLALAGCARATCPPGHVMNPTGDCVPYGGPDGDPAPDGDQDGDRPPDGDRLEEDDDTDPGSDGDAEADDEAADQVDGDMPDGDSGDGEADPPSECPLFQAGGVLDIDLSTVRVTFRLLCNGEPWVDASGRSRLHLRSIASGSRVEVLQVGDGGSLPPVTVLADIYDVQFETATSGRQAVMAGLDLTVTPAGPVEIELPLLELSGRVTLDGAPFTGFAPEHRGRIVLVNTSTRREADLFVTGGDRDDYSIQLYPGTYDIRFEGHLTDDGRSYQTDTLIKGVSLQADRELDFALASARVKGSVLFNGTPPPDGSDDRGLVVLINRFKKDRFAFVGLGSTGPVTFDRRVLKETYDVGFLPRALGEGEEPFAFRTGREVVVAEDINGDLDLGLIDVEGSITLRGGPYPDFVNLDRGGLWLRDPASGESFRFADLGRTGEPAFRGRATAGEYRVEFRGPLLDDPYFVGRSYPYSDHRVELEGTVALRQSGRADIDIPTAEIAGRLTRNGSDVVSPGAPGQFFSVRRAGDYRDIPVVLLGDGFAGPEFLFSLLPGDYSVRFEGSHFTGHYEYAVAGPTLNVAGDGRFDIDYRTAQVRLVLGDGGGRPLSAYLSEGTYDGVQVKLSDQVTRAVYAAATRLDEGGAALFETHTGRFRMLLRLTRGRSYVEFPLGGEIEIGGDLDRALRLPLVPLTVSVGLDGGPLTGADGTAVEDGQLLFISKTDYDTLGVVDLVADGSRDIVFRLPPDEYRVYFSGGSGTVLTPSFWMYQGCMLVRAE